MSEIAALFELLDTLEGPDPGTDVCLDLLLEGGNNGQHVPPYTASLDAAVGLVQRTLPGWLWRVMSCSVSDDAWVTPDFNDPVHGERLRAEWPQQCHVDPLGFLETDVDRRPAGNPAIALIQSLLIALQAIEKREAATEARSIIR